MAPDESKPLAGGQLAVGTLFDGKYRILGELGEGSFAYVLRAEHETMGRQVALKILKRSILEAHPQVAERFLTEVRVVSRLRHPNSVTVFDFGESEDGASYMVLEFVEGEVLEDVVARTGALSPERAVAITRQILEALGEAHSIGIVHRDLKPANVMLTKLGTQSDFVKVLDFGVAKVMSPGDEEPARDGKGRRSTQFIGTPIYMSPEQVLGQQVSPATDLYSLALVMYEMLAGEQPITADTVAEIVRAHIDAAPFPFQHFERVPPDLQRLIRKATQNDPKDRFENVEEFIDALDRASIEQEEPLWRDPDDSDEDVPDVFSGKGYIGELGDISGSFDPDKPVKRASKRRRKPSLPVTRPEPRPSPSVDVGKVKRDDFARRRDERVSVHQVRTLDARDRLQRLGWYLVGIVTGYFSFVTASASFGGSGVAALVVGTLPIGAALMWAQFSSVRRIHGDFGDRWLEPTARHMAVVFAAMHLVLLVTAPGAVASGLKGNWNWFLRGVDEGSALAPLAAVTEGVAMLLSKVFAIASRLLPW